MLTNDAKNDQKRHKTGTIESTSQNKASEATKLILKPETTRISTRMKKCRRLNRMCLDQNLEQHLASLERAWK